jgi:hypothetical protein
MGKPTGNALNTETIAATAVGWSAKRLSVRPQIMVTKGVNYCVTVKSTTVTGCYGFAYRDSNITSDVALYSDDDGNSFSAEKGKMLKLDVVVAKGNHGK